MQRKHPFDRSSNVVLRMARIARVYRHCHPERNLHVGAEVLHCFGQRMYLEGTSDGKSRARDRWMEVNTKKECEEQ